MSLVAITEVPPGESCESGGQRIDSGLDEDRDGELDEEEVENSAYVCSLSAPAGASSLVTVEEEPASANCEFGGQRIDTGVDSDGDGELAPNEIETTSYVCDPASSDARILARHAWARTAREPFFSLVSEVVVDSAPEGTNALALKRVGTTARDAEAFDEAAAEVVAVNPRTAQVFVVNSFQEVVEYHTIDASGSLSGATVLDVRSDVPEATGVNCVALANDTLAVALEVQSNPTEESSAHQDGRLAFYDVTTTTPVFLNAVVVGPQPDMVRFTPDGTKAITANEGEPPPDYSADPEASVSIVEQASSGGWAMVSDADVNTLGFTEFNVGGAREGEFPAAIRAVGPETSSRAQQLEPEYVAVAPDGATAWVVLQEQNAVAVIDLAAPRIAEIRSLGVKDALTFGNELDASDRDDAVRLANWPIYLMYQPDGMESYLAADGGVYYVTANEGDVRDDGWSWSEDARIASLELDSASFPGKESWQSSSFLGRLSVTTTLGDRDGDGDYDDLYAFGGRSFSIFDSAGALVFDSGNQFEAITARAYGSNFNNNHAEDDPDGRSDAKGPEPEALLVARINERTYAFIGLERIGGVMVYDITNPREVEFVTYFNRRTPGLDPQNEDTDADLGPEGFAFVNAAESPTGTPLLIAGNEVSGTTSVYSITVAQND